MPKITDTQATRLTGTASSHTHSGAAGDGSKDLALGTTGTVVFSDVTLSRSASGVVNSSGSLRAVTSVITDSLVSKTESPASINWGFSGATIAGHAVAIEDMVIVTPDGGWRWIFASDASLWTSGGFVAGSATSGYKGAGTINTAADIYKNNSAYTNPDYVLEHWLTGGIVLFEDSPGAADYPGIMPLDDLKTYIEENYQLPRVSTARGMFERSDIVLEKIEELTIYVLGLHERVKALEAV
jgi:hypothetical protein